MVDLDQFQKYKINKSGEDGSPFEEPNYLLSESLLTQIIDQSVPLNKLSANAKLGLPRQKMGKVYFAFDVDGTLRNNTVDQSKAPVANERIRTMLITLSTFKNVNIVVWSGSGELYARQVGASFGLDSYVTTYCDKQYYRELRSLQIVIAVDDIQDTAIGDVNLIVREK